MVDFIIGAIVNTGFGLTTIVYSNAAPSQLLDFGMIEYLMIWVVDVGFVNVISGKKSDPVAINPVIFPGFDTILHV